jgi:putative ABC transport system ATP-binding protein
VSTNTVIRVENLTKNYYLGTQAIPVLKGIDLEIQDGEYVAFTGSSGSGKSTLMNILGCLDTPTTGKYYLAGDDVSRLSDNELSVERNERIGFVFQTFNLLMRKNIYDNVALPLIYSHRKETNEKTWVLSMIDKVGLGGRVHHKPSEISGGQRQRVAIARALVTRPTLILADEPTGNLDSKTTKEIMELFDKLNSEGVTIVIVTHEEEIARHCKRRIHLVDGRVADATGTKPFEEKRKKNSSPISGSKK